MEEIEEIAGMRETKEDWRRMEDKGGDGGMEKMGEMEEMKETEELELQIIDEIGADSG